MLKYVHKNTLLHEPLFLILCTILLGMDARFDLFSRPPTGVVPWASPCCSIPKHGEPDNAVDKHGWPRSIYFH